ncbi:MAG: hypothetical protein V3T28_00440, partial [Gemmatimonadales bacterium]
PEQAMGEREITAKSDVYALGCVLYEMLTGEPPFVGPTAQAIIARVLTEQPRSLTMQRGTIPTHVDAAVSTALAKLPADRFGSAAQFADALANSAFTTPATAARTAEVQPSARPPVRSSGLMLVLGTIAIVASALAAWGWFTARSAARQPTTWQYINLGDDATLVTNFPSMALSPDGVILAFRDDRQDGLLWVKRRGQLDPTSIPGTERAQNPVFSPDGEWIAFVADGRIKKVRAAGGATVTLADSAFGGFGGVAWLDDGTLVYATPGQQQLRRVNAAGGSSTVALRDTALAGGGIGHPVSLPDARGVLFQVCSSGCVTLSLHVLDLRTGTQKPLLDDVAQAWYLPNGRLLYVRRDGVAVAAPFDLDRLEITGEAVPVLEGVEVRAGNGFASLVWSAAGSLVYVHGAGGARDYTVVRVGRNGSIAPIDTAWYGAFNSLDLSPGGRYLAVGAGIGGGLNIWIKQLDHGPSTRLTFGNQDRRPAWSPDGRLVAFVRDSANTSSVFARPADGSGPDEPLAHIDRQIQEVTWSPDGNWVLVRTDNGTTGAGDLVGVHVSGDSAPVPLVASPFTELHPAVSPDGRWLAYTSNESGINEIYVRPFPNTNELRWQVSNGGGQQPVWAADGRELFFLDADARLTAAQVQATPGFSTSGLLLLFDASGFALDAFHQPYDVTPDGRFFMFLSPRRLADANRDVKIVWVDHWFTDLEARLAQ